MSMHVKKWSEKKDENVTKESLFQKKSIHQGNVDSLKLEAGINPNLPTEVVCSQAPKLWGVEDISEFVEFGGLKK